MPTSTMMDYPFTVTQILRHGAKVHGRREVVTWQGDAARRVSFAETYTRIERLAAGLASLGVEPGDVVGTFCWNHQEHVEAYFAIPCMGAVLHTLNIRLFPEQLDFVLRDGGARVVIVDDSLVHLLAEAREAVAELDHVIVVGSGDASVLDRGILRYDDLLADHEPGFSWPDVDEHSAAEMCHTSGTTGDPKGVVYSHRSLWAVTFGAAASGVNLNPGDRALAIVPQFHVNAWGMIHVCWAKGCDILQPERYLQPEPLARFIAEERPHFAGGVPTIWNGILALGEREELDLSSLRLVLSGGSAVPRSLIDAYKQRYDIDIRQGWGMTEMLAIGAMAIPPTEVSDREEELDWRVRTGTVVAGVDIRLIAEDGTEQPWDGSSIGEVEVRGPWITGRYHNVEAPEKFHDGWLRTGDVAVIDEHGSLQIVDRTKDVIKSGGEWISSVDLENTLIAHDRVVEAAVIGVEDDRWGERPLGVVVGSGEGPPTPEELSAHLEGRVARWWVPERWTFIDEIPKTSVGKYDKKALRARHEAGELDIHLRE
jgi:fatty-acyl-CoA synthase